jgi:hypothetical protein
VPLLCLAHCLQLLLSRPAFLLCLTLGRPALLLNLILGGPARLLCLVGFSYLALRRLALFLTTRSLAGPGRRQFGELDGRAMTKRTSGQQSNKQQKMTTGKK